MPFHITYLLLLAAIAVQTTWAQRCNPGYDFYVPSPGAAGQCCYQAVQAQNAFVCNRRANWPNSPMATWGCLWLKMPDGGFGSFTPHSGLTQIRLIARGSHGDYLTTATEADKQTGWGSTLDGIVPVTPGQSVTFMPGSNYGCFGCGQPSGGQYTSTRNLTWTRGGASTYVTGSSWYVYAAGGGGQGQSGYRGTNADSGGPYRSGPDGGAADGGYGGGGGNGANGGFARWSPGGFPGAGGAGGRSFWGALPMTLSPNNDPLDQRASVEISWQCIPALPATTILTNVGEETVFEASTRYTSTETVTLPTITDTSYTTVESARPIQFTDSTFTPNPIPTTLTDTETTFPPSSTAFETSTPETSFYTETESIETTPATQTISETYTPPTSFFTETRTETISPGTVLETLTVTPPTRTIPASAQTTETVASGTLTAVVTSATGNGNCVTLRLVYPPACCPTAYIRGLASQTTPPRLRRRHVLFARDYTTITQRIGTKTETFTVNAISTTVTTPATVQTTVTETTPGPLTISTIVSTLPASTQTFLSTLTVEGVASTVTITETADAPSFTYTSTEYREAPTPLVTNTSTADAPSSTATDVELTTLATPTRTVEEEAPTPLTTSTSTKTFFTTVPAATTTTTQTVRSTTCAVKTVSNGRCPIALLKGADQIVQIALIKARFPSSSVSPSFRSCFGSLTHSSLPARADEPLPLRSSRADRLRLGWDFLLFECVGEEQTAGSLNLQSYIDI
ncbi:hypothetical protein JCM11251_003812 [Rhodosporidiobolus azoricus]